jgi:apolipoprotein N-acyltransferase
MIIMRNNLAMLSRNGPSGGRYILLISNDTFFKESMESHLLFSYFHAREYGNALFEN